MMNRRICQTLVILSLVCAGWFGHPLPTSASAADVPTGPDDPAELEAFLDGVMASQMDANHIAGAVVAVVKDGELFFSKGYGFSDLENRVPVDPERTLFRPGSVSKLFVWTAVMQLAEQGRLDLDADINTYLDFNIPATFPQPITLKHLMSHTPGFEDQGEELFKLQADQLTSLDEYLKTHVPARVFPPGELGAYSNYGTALAGYIVERVSGMPFDEYVEKNVFTPLNMTRSTFRQPVPPGLASDVSKGYYFSGGSYHEGGFEYVQAHPAGSLSATAVDMANFMIAHLQDGQLGEARILGEATAQQMQQQLFTHDPRIPGMAHGFFESVLNGQRILSHGGDTILFHSGLFLLHAEGLGIFVSANSTGGARTGAALLDLFMDHYYPPEDESPPPAAAGSAERMAPYVGEYYPARSNFTGFEKIMSLFQPARLRMDSEGNPVVSLMGETFQAAEVEPGLIQDRLEDSRRVVLRTDEAGQRYLLPREPFALLKTPWYATSTFQGLLFIGSLLLFLGTLIGWSIAFFARLRKRQPGALAPRAARWIAALFGLLFIVFLLMLVGLFTNINPAFGVPAILFETPPGMGVLMALPMIMAVLALAMLVFAVLAWIRCYWGWGGRIHYTLLALSALALIWALSYWNMVL